MPSAIALRALLGAGLGLGAFDLVWINAALAPRLVRHDRAAAPDPIATTTITMHAAPAPPPPAPADASAPPPTVADAEAVEAVTVTRRIYFATRSAALDAGAREALAGIVALAGPSAELVLEGHADHRGAESVNVTLSKDRALAVQQQLIELGVAAQRIRVDYAGESEATTDLQRDRRVDIQITGGTR